MNEKSRISARVNEDVKSEAEEIFEQMGLSTSAAISLFMSQVVRERGLPFRPHLLPNKETRQAMERARSGDVEKFENEKEMLEDLGMT